MNPMVTPDIVSAEVAYRYERDHVGPPKPERIRRPSLLQRLTLR